MTKKSFNLRNAVKTVAVLAGFLCANNVMAQDFNATIDGVTYTFSPTTENGIDVVRLKTLDVASFPSGLTKWVLPEMVTNGATTYRLVRVSSGAWSDGVVVSTNVTEIVFPKYVDIIYPELGSYWFPTSAPFQNVRKITFGENVDALPQCSKLPLDTIVFLGTSIIDGDGYGGKMLWSNPGLFADCPANTKIIVPCGTLNDYVTAFNHSGTTWSEPFFGGAKVWTSANFVEAPCLNTLTVLSSDVSLGNAISMSGGATLTTTTPANTSTTFSGTATLYALPKGGKLFVGWNDGNLDNPRIVTVSSDTTFTANFATCEGAGIEETRSAAAPLKVFPNPANSTLNVEVENYVNGTLTLFDMSGKVILSQAMNGTSAQINMSALTAGNYILRLVENGTASAGIQVIKQ